MQILFISLLLFLTAIAIATVLRFVVGRTPMQTLIEKYKDKGERNNIFIKKYKEVNIEKWQTTFRLVGLATTLLFILTSIELFAEKEPEKPMVIQADSFEQLLYLEEEENLETYIPPEKSVPAPPPPPLPDVPKIKEAEREVIPKKVVTEEISIPPLPPMPKPGMFSPEAPVLSPPPPPKPDNDNMDKEVLPFAQVMPEYPGGEKALVKEIMRNYNMPHQFKRSGAKKAKISLRFVVLENGEIGAVEILKGAENCRECDEEAVKSIHELKHSFSPGKQAGRPVKVWFSVPIYLEVNY